MEEAASAVRSYDQMHVAARILSQPLELGRR